MGRLKSFETLKNNKNFSSVYNNGEKWHCKCAVIFYKTSPYEQVGFVASKKVGNAVKRARAKRVLRAVFIEIQDSLKSGDFVFIAKAEILNLSYIECKKNIIWSLRKLKCFKK